MMFYLTVDLLSLCLCQPCFLSQVLVVILALTLQDADVCLNVVFVMTHEV